MLPQKKDAKKAVAYLMLCERFQMQNQYGPNDFCPIWNYSDGRLVPNRNPFNSEQLTEDLVAEEVRDFLSLLQ